ncbi:MAG: hypothetical protein ACOCQ4_01860 [bacterium]
MKKIQLILPAIIALVLSMTNLYVHAQETEVRKMTDNEFKEYKEKIGVYEEGKNYNKIINGHGTGLRPPTEEEWKKIREKQVVFDEYKTKADGSLPSSFDNSEFKWFPPVGNQDGEGSCVSWACGYYTKTFQEAYEGDWDLSDCEWTGGYDGNPEEAYQDKIFSPDFIYHQVNDGEDAGSFYFDNISLLENIGCASWEAMPYDPDDSHSWPSEDAWREAPLYRSETGYQSMSVETDEGIQDLEELIADTSLAIISIDTGQYENMTSEDLWTTDNYGNPERNHANTVVGYDDDFGPYEENGETRYGAFKVVNSWGIGNWENDDDGFLYISYECMKQHVNYIFMFIDKIGYNPEMIAFFP